MAEYRANSRRHTPPFVHHFSLGPFARLLQPHLISLRSRFHTAATHNCNSMVSLVRCKSIECIVFMSEWGRGCAALELSRKQGVHDGNVRLVSVRARDRLRNQSKIHALQVLVSGKKSRYM